MKSRLVLLLLAAHAGTALAQYKCTAANGSITFQQTPCFGAKSEEKLDVVPNGHPRPASGAAATPPPAPAAAASDPPSVNKRMLAGYELGRQREALEQAITSAQDEASRRNTQHAQAIDAARRQFGTDPANATALRDALAAIEQRYAVMADLDDQRIRSAQSALDHWVDAHAGTK